MAYFQTYQAGIVYPPRTLVLDSSNNLWESLTKVLNVTPGTDSFKWTEIGTVGSPVPSNPSGQGSPVVRKFPFAFDTPGILTGAALYTPTIGDILLDAWVEIDTRWDGTTPMMDFGYYTGSTGWFDGLGLFGPLNLAVSSDIDRLGSELSVGPVGYSLSIAETISGVVTQAVEVSGSGPALTVVADPLLNASRDIPAKMLLAVPIKVVVSQDGTNVGADPGSTQGAAVLYLITVTPV